MAALIDAVRSAIIGVGGLEEENITLHGDLSVVNRRVVDSEPRVRAAVLRTGDPGEGTPESGRWWQREISAGNAHMGGRPVVVATFFFPLDAETPAAWVESFTEFRAAIMDKLRTPSALLAANRPVAPTIYEGGDRNVELSSDFNSHLYTMIEVVIVGNDF